MASRSPSFSSVTVILGDPSLPDSTKLDHRYSPEDMEAVERMKAALSELSGYRFTYLSRHGGLLSELVTKPPAFVMNLCDTGYKNQPTRELHIPALLELLDIPYTGSGPVCLGMCYDKAYVRSIAMSHGVPVPDERYLGANEPFSDQGLTFPVLIKPCNGDGSVGITRDGVVQNLEEAAAYVDRLRREVSGRAVLIQEFLQGAEYGVSLIGNPDSGLAALPLLEVDYSRLDPALPQILSYESKTVPESPYWTHVKYRQARIDGGSRRQLVDYATLLFERLGCRDYARFDFRADAHGKIKLLEVNPNPAWCWDGKLNLMAQFAGYSYSELFRIILEAARLRISA